MRTIAHISDLHFGKLDLAVAEGLVDDLTRDPPSLVVASGDFTQRARAGQYREARAFLDRLPQPILAIPGNHDIPLYDIFRRFFFPLANYRRHITHDLRPVYRDDEMLVMGMNTARSFTPSFSGFWKDGAISPEQLLEVERHAAETSPTLVKILVTHHPFIPPPGERIHGIVRGATTAMQTLEACGIDLLLAGHLHMGYSGDTRTHFEAAKRSILSIQAGTATSTRRRSEPNAYNRITIEDGRVTVDVREWRGSAFVSRIARTFLRSADGWREEQA